MMSQARLMVEAKLTSELECVEWCLQKGLIHDAGECRRHRVRRRLVRYAGSAGIRWYCGKCQRGDAALSGSVFESLHMPLGRAVMLIYCFAWGLTYEQTQLACQLAEEDPPPSDSTVADWNAMLRDRLVDYADSQALSDRLIGGWGMIVQIDEALIGRRKYNRGRVVPGSWVVGLIDSSGNLRLVKVADRRGETLKDLILKYVARGSVIHTDGWSGYSGLDDLGYTHKRVNHSEEFVAVDGTHTQRIESQWRKLRRKFSRGGIRHDDIGEHLCEYVWREDCRKENRDPFLELLKLLQYEK